LRSAEYWLSRAEEARARADEMCDAFAKQAMMEVAATYEKLAHYTQSLRDKHDGGE
jgi:hypothetical protein